MAAYERAYTLDPSKASQSLFKPMLRLLTAASDETSGADRRATRPATPGAPSVPGPFRRARPVGRRGRPAGAAR